MYSAEQLLSGATGSFGSVKGEFHPVGPQLVVGVGHLDAHRLIALLHGGQHSGQEYARPAP